jgi:DNA-binding response OmpR family regulator
MALQDGFRVPHALRLFGHPSFEALPSFEFSGPKKGAPAHAGGYIPREILVIEDDPLHRDLIARVVALAGFKAHTAQDGEEGWEALCRVRYALAIIDHEMPRLTGLKLIERLRAVSADTPCILISVGLPGPVSELKEKVHPGDVLAKPFTIERLIESIFRVLGEGNQSRWHGGSNLPI